MTGRRLSWARLLARHLRLSAARWAVLALVVLVTSATVMAWPRWLERSATEEVRRELASSAFVDPTAVPSQVWVNVYQAATSIGTAEANAWGGVERTLDRVRTDAPEPLRSVLGEPGMYSIVTGAVAVPIGVASMTIRAFTSPGFLDRVEFVEGAAPAYSSYTADAYPHPISGEPGFEDFVPPPIELALSVEAAEALQWEVGETRTITSRLPEGPWLEQDLVLSGTYRATQETAASGWADQGLPLLQPSISYSAYQDVLVEARAYVPPSSSMVLLSLALNAAAPPTTRLWYPLLLDSVTMQEARDLAVQLHDLTTNPVPIEDYPATFSSEAPEIIDTVLGRQQATNAVLGLAVAAPAGVLLVLLALAASVIVQPRRTALGLLTARGASPLQVRTLLGVEAALVALPAAALGGLAAVQLVPAYSSPWWWLAPAVVAAAPICALALGGESKDRPKLRLIGELVVVLLTVAATVTLLTSHQLGATSDWQDTATSGGDPLSLVTPLLLAISVALGCLRLLPVLVRPVATRLRARPDLVPALGSTLAARRRAPLASTIAVATGAAVAVLGQVSTATVTEGLDNAARTSVGADVRIAGLLSEDDLTFLDQLDGVDAVATIVTPYSAATVITGVDDAVVTLYAVEPDALAAVQKDTPGALTVPAHDPGAPAPVVLSQATDLAVGDVGEMVVGSRFPVEVAALERRAPGLTNAGVWGAIDVAALREAGIDLSPNAALVDLTESGSVTAADTVAALREHFKERATITAYDERVAQLSEAPTATALRIGLAVVSVLGVGAAVVAVLLTLAGASAQRTRLVSVLRTLGLPQRAELRLVLWEIAPAAGLALVVGAGLGFGLAALLVQVTDLRPFTGTAEQPPLVLAPVGLTLTLLGVALAVVVAVVVAAWAAGRRSAAVVLRVGEGSS